MECSECARNCDLQTDIPHCWGNVQQDEHVREYNWNQIVFDVEDYNELHGFND